MLALATRGEGVELSKKATNAVEVSAKVCCFLNWGAGLRNRANERYRVGVDGKVGQESKVEERELVTKTRVRLQQAE